MQTCDNCGKEGDTVMVVHPEYHHSGIKGRGEICSGCNEAASRAITEARQMYRPLLEAYVREELRKRAPTLPDGAE